MKRRGSRRTSTVVIASPPTRRCRDRPRRRLDSRYLHCCRSRCHSRQPSLREALDRCRRLADLDDPVDQELEAGRCRAGGLARGLCPRDRRARVLLRAGTLLEQGPEGHPGTIRSSIGRPESVTTFAPDSPEPAPRRPPPGRQKASTKRDRVAGCRHDAEILDAVAHAAGAARGLDPDGTREVAQRSHELLTDGQRVGEHHPQASGGRSRRREGCQPVLLRLLPKPGTSFRRPCWPLAAGQRARPPRANREATGHAWGRPPASFMPSR